MSKQLYNIQRECSAVTCWPLIEQDPAFHVIQQPVAKILQDEVGTRGQNAGVN